MTEAYARTNRIEDVAVYPIINAKDYVDTGFYLIPKAEFVERPVKLGRWDAATGQVVMDEPGTVRPTPTEPLPGAKRRKFGRPTVDPLTDPRRTKVLELWADGKSIDRIGTVCHMHEYTAKAILKAAGVYQEGGTEAHRHQTVTGGKLTFAKVAEILAAGDESPIILAARYGVSRSQISSIRNGHSWKNVPRTNPGA